MGLLVCRWQEEIGEINRESKVFKAALKDLVTMGRGALTRGTKAVETSLKNEQAQLAQLSDSKVGRCNR